MAFAQHHQPLLKQGQLSLRIKNV